MQEYEYAETEHNYGMWYVNKMNYTLLIQVIIRTPTQYMHFTRK